MCLCASVIQAKVVGITKRLNGSGISHFLVLYLHHILWHNKVLLLEMQNMWKVTFTDV